jgi:hypothetical protein
MKPKKFFKNVTHSVVVFSIVLYSFMPFGVSSGVARAQEVYQEPVNMQQETPVEHVDSGTWELPPRDCGPAGCLGDPSPSPGTGLPPIEAHPPTYDNQPAYPPTEQPVSIPVNSEVAQFDDQNTEDACQNDGCNGQQDVAIPSMQPTAIPDIEISFSVSTALVVGPTTIRVSWESKNAEYCVVNGLTVVPNGYFDETVFQTKSYHIDCYGSDRHATTNNDLVVQYQNPPSQSQPIQNDTQQSVPNTNTPAEVAQVSEGIPALSEPENSGDVSDSSRTTQGLVQAGLGTAQMAGGAVQTSLVVLTLPLCATGAGCVVPAALAVFAVNNYISGITTASTGAANAYNSYTGNNPTDYEPYNPAHHLIDATVPQDSWKNSAAHVAYETLDIGTSLGVGWLYKSLSGAAGASETGNIANNVNKTWGNVETLSQHFIDHGSDFGSKTAEEYAETAAKFRNKNGLRGIRSLTDKDGILRMYEESTNTFAAYNANGTTKTFFKPDAGLKYWLEKVVAKTATNQ